MHLVTLQFVRIFDVVRVPETRHIPKHTMFGFESGKEAQYGVSVPGWPELKDGHTVTVLLERANDWQSVQGWINRSTGELTSFPASQSVAGVCVGLIVLAASFAFFSKHGLPLSIERKAFATVWLVFFSFMIIVSIRHFLQRRRVVNILRNSTYARPTNTPIDPNNAAAGHHKR